MGGIFLCFTVGIVSSLSHSCSASTPVLWWFINSVRLHVSTTGTAWGIAAFQPCLFSALYTLYCYKYWLFGFNSVSPVSF